MERHPNRESVIGLYPRDHPGTGKLRISENPSTLVIVFCIVGRVAQGEGGAFPVTKRALLSALDDAGLLARKDKGRYTVKEVWREKRSRMLCLKQKDFISPE